MCFRFLAIDAETTEDQQVSSFSKLHAVPRQIITQDILSEQNEYYQNKMNNKSQENAIKFLQVIKLEQDVQHSLPINLLFEYGIKIMAFYQTISYNNAELFEWLNDEVSNARRVGDKT